MTFDNYSLYNRYLRAFARENTSEFRRDLTHVLRLMHESGANRPYVTWAYLNESKDEMQKPEDVLKRLSVVSFLFEACNFASHFSNPCDFTWEDFLLYMNMGKDLVA